MCGILYRALWGTTVSIVLYRFYIRSSGSCDHLESAATTPSTAAVVPSSNIRPVSAGTTDHAQRPHQQGLTAELSAASSWTAANWEFDFFCWERRSTFREVISEWARKNIDCLAFLFLSAVFHQTVFDTGFHRGDLLEQRQKAASKQQRTSTTRTSICHNLLYNN